MANETPMSESKQKKNFTFRLDPALVKELDEAAHKDDRSRTNAVEKAIREYIARMDRE